MHRVRQISNVLRVAAKLRLSWEKGAGGQSGAWAGSASERRRESDDLHSVTCPGGGGIVPNVARAAGAQSWGSAVAEPMADRQ